MSSLITEAAASDHAAVVLPIPAAAYGLLAFTALIGLLFVAYAFRSVGTRH